jgi:hypothetical protein
MGLVVAFIAWKVAPLAPFRVPNALATLPLFCRPACGPYFPSFRIITWRSYTGRWKSTLWRPMNWPYSLFAILTLFHEHPHTLDCCDEADGRNRCPGDYFGTNSHSTYDEANCG